MSTAPTANLGGAQRSNRNEMPLLGGPQGRTVDASGAFRTVSPGTWVNKGINKEGTGRAGAPPKTLSGRAAAPGFRCRTWRRSPSVSPCRAAPRAVWSAPWQVRPLPRGTPRSPPDNFAGVTWPAPFRPPRSRGVLRAVSRRTHPARLSPSPLRRRRSSRPPRPRRTRPRCDAGGRVRRTRPPSGYR